VCLPRCTYREHSSDDITLFDIVENIVDVLLAKNPYIPVYNLVESTTLKRCYEWEELQSKGWKDKVVLLVNYYLKEPSITDDDVIRQRTAELLAMGFDERDVGMALHKTNYNILAAVNLIHSGLQLDK
jgi:hypothetical protein